MTTGGDNLGQEAKLGMFVRFSRFTVGFLSAAVWVASWDDITLCFHADRAGKHGGDPLSVRRGGYKPFRNCDSQCLSTAEVPLAACLALAPVSYRCSRFAAPIKSKNK